MTSLDLFCWVPDEKPAPTPYFNSPDPLTPADTERLSGQHVAIRDLMLDGKWRTLAAISETLNYPAASVSAQLRHLRKKRFGSFIVDRRHLGRGLYEYRVQKGVP